MMRKVEVIAYDKAWRERYIEEAEKLSEVFGEKEEYSSLKEKLAKRFPYDIDAYIEGKGPFIQRIETAALQWYRNR
ncbi:GrpB family protein [Bacillus tianshenii]|nr:GrpB family protein [Bacillus tianshenii]